MSGKKTCLCCGYVTLTSEIHDICEICYWQDDPSCWDDADAVWGSNGISLRKAQKRYEENCKLDQTQDFNQAI
ncbi:CPCC family cysteine-rich protein [Ectobacillus funiculus]|uniref:CPCC family cysteine-rich protein n=1 Tax=Ectobacillus funiculus TaxID=137993 RepID=UPI00397AA50C